MDLRALSYFVAVAEERSFTRAADRLHIVQPAVSQRVRRLEAELGVTLFTRTTRSVTLTAAGERLLPEARAVLAAADRTRRVAADLAAGREDLLRLATSSGLGSWLHRVLDALAAARPGLAVRLTSMPYSERLQAVATGALDAAFVQAAGDAPEGVELVPLASAPVIGALPATHPLATRDDAVTIVDLVELPVRLAPRARNPAFYDLMTAALADAGGHTLHPSPFTTLQNTLAEVGTGPPTWAPIYGRIAELPTAPGIAYRVLDRPLIVTALAVRSGPPISAVRALLDACSSASAAEPDAT